jgi:hypothetical protein
VLNCDVMHFFVPSRTGAASIAVLTVALCHAQDATSKDAPVREAQSIPARATPGDYQAHAVVGNYTIAAEFTQHAVPTPAATFTTEDYVAVEVAFFGPADSRLMLSFSDFSLRLNGKKPLAATAYTLVFKSLKDPDWDPPEAAEAKQSKTSIGGGGKNQDGGPPPVPHMPLGMERTMNLRVQKAALPDGEHSLPAAGLVFFSHHGKTESLHSIELIYNGPAGKATLALQR